MDAVQGTLVLKKLIEVRGARRKIKEEYSVIQSAFSRFNPSRVSSIKLSSPVIFKTTSVKDILGMKI